MNDSISGRWFLFLIALFILQGVEFPSKVFAQDRSVATKMPALGEAVTTEQPTSTSFPGNPISDGLSFDTLADLLKHFAKQGKAVTRGAREIAIFRKAAPAVVLLRTKEAIGSGVMLADGSILTNRHVVEGIGRVQIFFKPNGRGSKGFATETRIGTVKFVDPKRDLAIIVPESLPIGFKSLKISAQNDFEIGADVYAIGHPLGYTWTFTQGIISGIRTIDTNNQHYMAIQTQTPINPGNSGGPLLNSQMEVIGINTWARDISEIEKKKVAGEDLAITRPAQGLNFAVSAPDLRSFISDTANGKIRNLALHMPQPPSGCRVEVIFSGRTKSNDASIKTFSLRCDRKIDAWEIFPDDKAKAIQFHLDPDRTGHSSIIVFSNPATGKWKTSLWDFFRDRTFAVTGRHDDGKIQPTKFEYTRR